MQVPKLITTNTVEHFELMRDNILHYQPRFPSGLSRETPHVDIGIVLGYAPVTPLQQATEADQADSEHASQASAADMDSQHAPRHAPISAEASWCDKETPGQRDGSERDSQPGSPEYRATSPSFSVRGSDRGSQASGAFSPQYEVTSPSYSPRGSQDGAPGKPASPLQPMVSSAAAHDEQAPPQSAVASDAESYGHATTESASAGQGSSDEPAQDSRLVENAAAPADSADVPAQAPRPQKNAAALPDNADVPAQASRPQENAAATPDSADIARPSTARGRDSTQQRSAFCFARPPRTQADEPEKLTHAASAEDGAFSRAQVSSSRQATAEEAHQCLAAGSGTTRESTDPLAMATAHHSAAVPADAVLSEVVSRLQQAEGEQAEAAPIEAVQAQAVQTAASQKEDVQAASSQQEGAQTQAVQAASSQQQGVQTQAEAIQAAGVPSPFAQQAHESKAHAKPTFVWGQSETSASNSSGSNSFTTHSPSPSFATQSTPSFGGFQAGGSSSQQPSGHAGRTANKHRTSRGKQSGGAGSVPEHPGMHNVGQSMQTVFAAAAGQSVGGAESTNNLFAFSTDAAELSSGKRTFSFGGSSQHAFGIGQSATAGSATAGSATAGSATAGSATAGSATAGSAIAGSATAGSGTTSSAAAEQLLDFKFAFGDAEPSSASPATAKASTESDCVQSP